MQLMSVEGLLFPDPEEERSLSPYDPSLYLAVADLPTKLGLGMEIPPHPQIDFASPAMDFNPETTVVWLP